MTTSEIVKFDSGMNRIVGESPEIEKVASGFQFTEGPVWHQRDELLYFTDFPDLKIYTWSWSGGLTTFRDPSARDVGLTLDRQGHLISCESLQHRVARTEKDDSVTGFVNQVDGVRINSPNDLVMKSDGTIYFTDPYSTLMGHPREMPFNGVYCLDPEAGTLRAIIEDLDRPNGIAFSPSEGVLYVNDTSHQLIKAYDVLPDGTVTNGKTFGVMDPSYGKGAADGMKVDVEGNVYVTGPGGVWVFSPDGARLGIIGSPEVVGNFCFGDDDWKSLYLTASTSVYRLRVRVPGVSVGE